MHLSDTATNSSLDKALFYEDVDKKATEEKTVKAVAKVDVKAPAVAETVEKKEEVKEQE